jgi:hypothetical protein
VAKPVETQYGDNWYPSRLSARWAVFFDLLGVRFAHRPITYTLTDLGNRPWTPDFVLPEVDRDLNDLDVPRRSFMLVRENEPSADDIEAAMYMSRCNLMENVYLFVGPPPGRGTSCFAFGKDPTPIPKSFGQCQFCGRIYIGQFRDDDNKRDVYTGHYGCMEECEYARVFNIDSAFMDFTEERGNVPLTSDSPILRVAAMAAQDIAFGAKENAGWLAGVRHSIEVLRQNRCFSSRDLSGFTAAHAFKMSIDERCPRFDHPTHYVHQKHRESKSQSPCPCRRCTNEREGITERQLEKLDAPNTVM